MSAYPVRLDGREVIINEYFDSNPEHVAGRLTVEHTPWSRNPRTTVVPEFPPLRLHLEIALGRIVQRAHRRNLAIPLPDEDVGAGAGRETPRDPARRPRSGQGAARRPQVEKDDSGPHAVGGERERQRRRPPSADPPTL